MDGKPEQVYVSQLYTSDGRFGLCEIEQWSAISYRFNVEYPQGNVVRGADWYTSFNDCSAAAWAELSRLFSELTIQT
jgi:hypothetical protein